MADSWSYKKNAVRASHPNRIADVNLSLARPRCPLIEPFALQRLIISASAAGSASVSEDASAPIVLSGLQSRYARPFSEEAATPGLPATLVRFGNRSATLRNR